MSSKYYTEEELNTQMNHKASFLARDLRLGIPGTRVSSDLPCEKIGDLVALARLRYGAEVVDEAIAKHQTAVDAVEQGGCPACNGRMIAEKTVLCEEHRRFVNAPRVDISHKLR